MTKKTSSQPLTAFSQQRVAMTEAILAHHPRRTEELLARRAPAPAAAATAPKPTATRSKNFVLADMEGRGSKDNRACANCIATLNSDEVAQVNWHVTEEQACRLCQVSEVKPEAYTKPFLDFLTENPTVFHTVHYFKTKLDHLGFTQLSARDSWADKIEPGGKYWTSRNGSTIIAFTVGKSYKPGDGVGMVGGHIDALTAKLKPVSTKPTKAGYLQLGVAPYAGALNPTWWDRDLSIGGRVVVRDEETGTTTTKLVKLDWPIAKVPTLAPHFGVGMMGQNNGETQAVPIIGLESASGAEAEALAPAGSFVNSQPPKLVKLISKELGIKSYTSIANWELELYDSQPAQLLGLEKELLTAGRIDDKLCSWAAFNGLLASDDNEDEGYIKLVALFDDEEIGSLLRQGAKGNFLPLVIERTVEALNPKSYGPGLLGQTYAHSFLISADVTHAGNPNFLGNYLEDHIPKLNVGIVLAGDSNGHMTTDAVSAAILQRTADLSDNKVQNFQIRNDSRSGGTIGPSLSSMMGVRSVDAGIAQLSMHSIRATIGALDPGLGVKFFKGFYDNFEKVDGEWQ